MNALAGRRIVLGVCGGIAAYKAIEVCRRLVDAGVHVIPVLTRGATRFVGEVTFSALASEKAQTSLWDEASPIPHTNLGQRADAIVVCPATARVLSDLRTGRSADLLTATLLATRAPVVVCPAMHTEMWEHPAVQDNIAELVRRGVHVVAPETGRLAGGDVGTGRLASPDAIVAAIEALFRPNDLAGLRVLVTAGGTREAIDPVRFIGNRSSGKQGVAIARDAAARGAKVTLVSTVELPVPRDVDVVRVESAAEMEAAVAAHSDAADIIVMAAAVADFRPARPAAQKLKKEDGVPEIVLERTPDILAGLGQRKRADQVLVGFAAETADLRANAAAKLARKGADLIVANDVTQPRVGFEHDTNAVVIFGADGSEVEVPLSDKHEVASAVLDAALRVRSNAVRRSPGTEGYAPS
ncbi:MAG TPA: bifunctional phosphopantothenoylcysteine decarboxylase/phosphopantothenate--cysteine ligase CoaBC [Acidimicrobiales bacterium]